MALEVPSLSESSCCSARDCPRVNGPAKLLRPPTPGTLGINGWPPYNFNSGCGKMSLAFDLRNINSIVSLGPRVITFA